MMIGALQAVAESQFGRLAGTLLEARALRRWKFSLTEDFAGMEKYR